MSKDQKRPQGIVIISKELQQQIGYSEKYYDEDYEYRHVVLPKELISKMPKKQLLSEIQWRQLGVQQSRGWVHYTIHGPEPHILLFRRLLPGRAPPVE